MPAQEPHRSPFGHAPGGQPVDCWRLESAAGVSAEILTYGGILHAPHVPDPAGRRTSVALSPPDPAAYAAGPYFGALVGRYANRIGSARFLLDRRLQRLPANDRGHTLHRGPGGFRHRLWQAEPLPGALRPGLHSPDGDMGFPGALDVSAAYALGEDGTPALSFEARTDRTTVVNLTDHAYFNLAGAAGLGGPEPSSGAILRHMLRTDADGFLPVSTESVPWGPEQLVAGTPFDFTAARPLGDGRRTPDRQVKAADGYDHCWVLRPPADPAVPRAAAVLHDPGSGSGRTMEVRTTEPGIQVYTANQLDGSLAGPGGRRYGPHDAVCLETQHLPDSPNRAEYPSTVLRPDEVLRSRTEFRFPHLTGGRP